MGVSGKAGLGVTVLVMLASSTSAAQQRRLAELPCTELFGKFDGVTRDAIRCGTVTVPQDRAAPNDPRLLAVVLPVVVYANPSAHGTPVVFLAGGPGESAIEAAQQALLQTPLGQMLIRERPIIAFDRRGIATVEGRTSPDLGTVPIAPRYPRAQAVASLRDSAESAAKNLRSHGVEPKNFTTLASVDDIADVVRALGYTKVVLLAGSYGTRDALQFMRLHPDMVETAVLDGIAPPSATTMLDSAAITASARAIVGRIVADCKSDDACSAEYADLPRAVQRLGSDSARSLRRTANFPVAGGWRTLEVNSASVMSVLGLASTSEVVRAEVPRVLLDFASGDTLHVDLSAKVLATAAVDPAMMTGSGQRIPLVRYITLCADRPQGEPFAGDRTVCNALDVPFSGPAAIAPVSSNIPTLLISSGYDAQTPPELGEIAARTLPHSQRVLFPTVGHVAFVRPVAMACAAIVIESFLAQPDRTPATNCIASVRPAFVPRGITSGKPGP